jgi:hypothetical protein
VRSRSVESGDGITFIDIGSPNGGWTTVHCDAPAAPGGDTAPLSHVAHEVAPTASEYIPVAHGAHGMDGSGLESYLPATQLSHEFDEVDPTGAYVPAIWGHAVHCVAPTAYEYVPAAHKAHGVEGSASSSCVPALHSMHSTSAEEVMPLAEGEKVPG